jgi:hypothetical protein
MAGLVPAIHVSVSRKRKTWMSRDEPGHDDRYVNLLDFLHESARP